MAAADSWAVSTTRPAPRGISAQLNFLLSLSLSLHGPSITRVQRGRLPLESEHQKNPGILGIPGFFVVLATTRIALELDLKSLGA
jgi:hypothetical protein